MSQTVRVPPRQRMQRQGTVEALLNDGLDALDTAPLLKYQADWRLLLEKLENLATSSSSSASKPNEFVSTESGVPIEPVVDDTPRRCVFNDGEPRLWCLTSSHLGSYGRQ